MLSLDPLSLDGAMLDEARAYLRIEHEEEDASLAAILLSAMAQAEQYLGQILLRRTVREILPASTCWQRLHGAPFVSANSATAIPAEGASFTVTSFSTSVDARGDGWFRVNQAGIAGRVELTYSAGLATGWAALPEAIRLGVLRLTAHLHAYRDDPADTGFPEAAKTLLASWRRIRLS
jgi:uncharacterized phiE125 gp8 family phage protein